MQHLNMKIEVLESVAGVDFSFACGEIVEVSPELGKSLVNAKQARLVSKPKSSNTKVDDTDTSEGSSGTTED